MLKNYLFVENDKIVFLIGDQETGAITIIWLNTPPLRVLKEYVSETTSDT